MSVVTNSTNAASNLLHKALFGTMLGLSAALRGDQLAAKILVLVKLEYLSTLIIKTSDISKVSVIVKIHLCEQSYVCIKNKVRSTTQDIEGSDWFGF